MKKRLEHLGTFKDWKDGTIKSVYQNNRGIIEATLIFNKTKRNADVYCVPSHNYCNLGCVMCHLTKEGAENKKRIKINAQDLIYAISQTAYSKKTNQRWSQNKNGWLAFMGVGEPLLNLGLLKDVYGRESQLKELCGYENMTYAVSTMMPNRNLETLAQYVNDTNFPLKIHFSMHSPFTEERFALLPSTRVGIREALELLTYYKQTIQNNRKIQKNFSLFHKNMNPLEIHYTLIKGKNDSYRHLEKVSRLLNEFKIPFKILKFNPTKDLEWSGKDEEWKNELKKAVPGVKIKTYDAPGKSIGSSCGEFTTHYYLSELETEEEKREFLEWKRKHQIE